MLEAVSIASDVVLKGIAAAMANPINWKQLSSLWLLPPLSLSCWLGLISQKASAQITPDTTLGSESSRIRNVSNVSDRIEGGAIRGKNLFHSFTEFNIDEGREAYFVNPIGIANILSRVTGDDVSDILGTLGVEGTANLFFLNPNGIIFGPNARLDISGSFVVSTADRFTFPNGSSFSAINPEAPPLLTINVPVGLQYGADSTGNITSQGNLQVGQDFTLSANNLDLQGQLLAGQDLTLQAQDALQIRDSIANPFIAASREQMLVQGNQNVNIFALNHSDSGLFSGTDMVLRSPNPINGDAHYWSGGSFRIEQLDGTLGDLFSEYDPIIRSQGDVSFFGYQGASLHILAGGSVNIGTVIITGPDTIGDTINPNTTPDLANVTLSDGTSLVIDGSERPTLDIRAGVSPEIIDNPLGTSGENPVIDQFFDSSLFLIPPPDNNLMTTSADITVGDIFVSPINGLVFITNQYEPNQTLVGDISISGDGVIRSRNGEDFNGIATNGNSIDSSLDTRNIIIESRENIILQESVIFATNPNSRGNNRSGDIVILAEGNITLSPDVSLVSEASVGGSISLRSGANIFATASEIRSISLSENLKTDGGNVEVTANDSIVFERGAGIFAVTFGRPNAGNVHIRSGQAITFTGTIGESPGGVRSQVDRMASGNGGNVVINTQLLRLSDGARITTNSFGSGNAGQIMISASDVEAIGESAFSGDASGIFADTTSLATGNGGNITILADRLLVINGAQVSASTQSNGNGGDLTIIAEEVETSGTASGIRFPSGLFANVNASSQGDGGDLLIEAEHLLIEDGAQISASTFGSGNSGNLTVRTRSVEVRGAQYSARTIDTSSVRLDLAVSTLSVQANPSAVGNSGKLSIETDRLLVADGAQVSASTQGSGDAGNLIISARSAEVTGFFDVEVAGQPFLRSSSSLLAQVEASANGNGGDLIINAGNLLVADEANLSVETQGVGRAGNMTLTSESLSIETGAEISATTTATATPAEQGGSITIRVSRLNLSDAGGIFAQTEGDTPSGSVILRPYPNQSSLTINLQDDAQISASTSSNGRGGDLRITAPETIRIRGNGNLSVETNGQGNAGSITITAPNLIVEDEAEVTAQSTGLGRAGNLTIENVDQFTLQNDAQLTVSSVGSSRAGNLTIDARHIFLDGSVGINAQTEASKTGGDIDLNVLETLRLDNNSQISASTQDGQGGTVTINANRSPTNLVVLNGGSRLQTEAEGSGDAGTLRINTGILRVQERASVSVSSQQGETGNLSIQAGMIRLDDGSLTAENLSSSGGNIDLWVMDSLRLLNNSQISASTRSGRGGTVAINANRSPANFIALNGGSRLETEAKRSGDAGALSINTGILRVQEDASVSVSSQQGETGNLTIETRTIRLDEGNLIAENLSGGGGNIELRVADNLRLLNNSQISASTQRGQGGSVTINANQSPANQVELSNGSSIVTEATGRRGNGNAGNLDINMRQLSLQNSAISASTQTGRAGSLTITALNQINLRGEGGLSVEASGNGRAGDLSIQTEDLIVQEGASVSVSSPQGQAGNLAIGANTIRLDNGKLDAETNQSGADITLQDLELLLMSSRSEISAEASGNARGGNVSINANGGFVVAVPNQDSDIVASASRGRGGNIQITTQGIFGLVERPAVPGNGTNDIDASSQFGTDGIIVVDDLGIDPVQAVAELPTDTETPPLSQGCQPGIDGRGRFVNTEQGGIPSNPTDPLDSGRGWEDVQPANTEAGGSKDPQLTNTVIEAEGWQVNERGQVVLLAELSTTPVVFDCQLQ